MARASFTVKNNRGETVANLTSFGRNERAANSAGRRLLNRLTSATPVRNRKQRRKPVRRRRAPARKVRRKVRRRKR